jgi:hypothetical protein
LLIRYACLRTGCPERQWRSLSSSPPGSSRGISLRNLNPTIAMFSKASSRIQAPCQCAATATLVCAFLVVSRRSLARLVLDICGLEPRICRKGMFYRILRMKSGCVYEVAGSKPQMRGRSASDRVVFEKIGAEDRGCGHGTSGIRRYVCRGATGCRRRFQHCWAI